MGLPVNKAVTTDCDLTVLVGPYTVAPIRSGGAALVLALAFGLAPGPALRLALPIALAQGMLCFQANFAEVAVREL